MGEGVNFRQLVGAPAWSPERERNARAARVNEDAAASALSRSWSCEFFRFADNSPVDWYCERDGHFIGVAEIKCRKVTLDTYPTIWLAVRKFEWLAIIAERHKCGAVFVVGYTDALAWIEQSEIAAEVETIKRAGRTDRGLRNDVEPMIEIPVSSLKRVVTVVREEPTPI